MNDQQTGQIFQQVKNLEQDVVYLRQHFEQDIRDLQQRLDEDYVTKDSFTPIARIVYALVSLILLGFFGTLSTLIYNNHVKP